MWQTSTTVNIPSSGSNSPHVFRSTGSPICQLISHLTDICIPYDSHQHQCSSEVRQRHRHIGDDCTRRVAVCPSHQGGSPIVHCRKSVEDIALRPRHSPFRNRRIQSWYPECWVTWRRSETLHTDEPWWWRQGRYRQRFYELGGQITRTLVLQLRLKLLAFVVPMTSLKT